MSREENRIYIRNRKMLSFFLIKFKLGKKRKAYATINQLEEIADMDDKKMGSDPGGGDCSFSW